MIIGKPLQLDRPSNRPCCTGPAHLVLYDRLCKYLGRLGIWPGLRDWTNSAWWRKRLAIGPAKAHRLTRPNMGQWGKDPQGKHGAAVRRALDVRVRRNLAVVAAFQAHGHGSRLFREEFLKRRRERHALESGAGGATQ